MVGDVALFREHGLPPRAGGLLDQSAQWYDALTIVDRELATIRAEHAQASAGAAKING